MIVGLEKIKQDPIYSSKNISVPGEENSFAQTRISAYGVKVYFEHAPAYTGIYAHMKGMAFMYTIELFENSGDGKSQKIQVIPCPITAENNTKADIGSAKQINNDGTDIPLISKMKEYECLETITDLEMGKEYTIRVNTIINGKTLGYKTESFGPLQTNED